MNPGMGVMNNKIDLKLLKRKGVFEHEDDYIMYVLINSDVHMELDQLISQSCESIIKVIRLNEQRYNMTENYSKWTHNDETKIFLKASSEDLIYAINNYSNLYDIIWCQHTLDLNDDNSPFTITSVAFTPFQRKYTPAFIRNLKNL